jgi:uncharacterized protein YutE (UPF0331/DUF86 family)
MSPQILKEKLERLNEYLESLSKYKDISYKNYLANDHFAIERIIELLVTTATDILMHKMSLKGESIPTTLRTVFLRAGELNWTPTDLAQRLADSAGMRNLLVHGYDKVDHRIIYDSIKPALLDYTQFSDIMLKGL